MADIDPRAHERDAGDHAHNMKSMEDVNKRLRTGRRTLGLILLAFVIFLWTATSFLASAILADHSFSQPFFITYVNTLFFALPLGPALIHRAYKRPEDWANWKKECKASLCDIRAWVGSGTEQDATRGRRDSNEARESLLGQRTTASSRTPSPRGHPFTLKARELLSLRDTAKLSLQFCFLWFTASYLLLACLERTTVASSTILTSTASGFTLVFGAIIGVEKFALRKVLSVLLCFLGVIVISSVDFSGKSSDDEHRGQFPEKTSRDLTIGNALALLAAMIYAVYITRMKKCIPDETKISMPVFFGFIGLFNALLLWPGFFILHWVGLETFKLPAAGRVTYILLINGLGSMVSDVAWAYAVLLTSPVLVTVGLSMTIPLTLVGQMVLSGQTSTPLYWIGACIVAFSFFVVNQEEKKEELGRQLDADDRQLRDPL